VHRQEGAERRRGQGKEVVDETEEEVATGAFVVLQIVRYII
jgi:hypothetical protein